MIQQLLGHLDANSRSPASVRAGIVEVLSEAAVIEASGSVGQFFSSPSSFLPFVLSFLLSFILLCFLLLFFLLSSSFLFYFFFLLSSFFSILSTCLPSFFCSSFFLSSPVFFHHVSSFFFSLSSTSIVTFFFILFYVLSFFFLPSSSSFFHYISSLFFLLYFFLPPTPWLRLVPPRFSRPHGAGGVQHLAATATSERRLPADRLLRQCCQVQDHLGGGTDAAGRCHQDHWSAATPTF